MNFGKRQVALVLGTSVLSVALVSGVAAAAFQPAQRQASAHPERTERGKPPLPKLEEILDKLVVDGKLTATQREAILAAVKQFADKAEEKHTESSWKGHFEDYLKTAATFLGLTEKELHLALRDGKSLAELVTAPKTRAGLIAAITARANARVDEAVAANKMTAEQATKAKAEIAERAGKLVDAKHEPKDKEDRAKDKDKSKDEKKDRHDKDERKSEQKMHIDVHKLLGDSLRSAIAYLGLEARAVQEQLRSGKSLAELATGTKTRAGLIAAIIKPADDRVDALQAEGKLTAEQATKIKAQVADAAAKIADTKSNVRKVTPPGQAKKRS